MNGLQETTFNSGHLKLEESDMKLITGNHLMSDGKNTNNISREDFEFLPVPECTDPFQPIDINGGGVMG